MLSFWLMGQFLLLRGEGGFRPKTFERSILNFRVVFGPWTQCNAAHVRPWSKNPKSWVNWTTNLSETFKIDVNIDFANTNQGGFLINAPNIIWAQKPKIARLLGFWGPKSKIRHDYFLRNPYLHRFWKNVGE